MAKCHHNFNQELIIKLTFCEVDDINTNKILEALRAYGALMMRASRRLNLKT